MFVRQHELKIGIDNSKMGAKARGPRALLSKKDYVLRMTGLQQLDLLVIVSLRATPLIGPVIMGRPNYSREKAQQTNSGHLAP